MRNGSSLPALVLLAITGLWAVVTAVVAAAAGRLADAVRAGDPPQLAPEAWGVAAASGAAGGAIVGVSAAAPSLVPGTGADVLGTVLAVTAGAMLLGAAIAAGLLLLTVWLWTGSA